MTLILLLVGCNTEQTESPTNSLASSSSMTASSDELSSKLASSSEPASSEVDSSELVSSKTEPPKATSVPPNTTPVSSTKEMTFEEFDKQFEQERIENAKPTNATLDFVVTDLNDVPIEGIITNYRYGIPPSDGSGLAYNDYNRATVTDKDGFTSVKLVKQEITRTLDGAYLTWDRPFKASVTTVTGTSAVFTAVASHEKDGTYICTIENIYPTNLFGFTPQDNQSNVINAEVEEITE